MCLFLSRCRKSALLRRWLVRALFADHVRATCEVCLFQCELMVKYEIMVVACQIGPFHLKLTQIKSEMNCITKHKCTESQKLDTRRRGENLNATSHVSRATTYTFLQSLFLHLYSMWHKTGVRKSAETKSYSVECLITRPIGDSHQDLIRFNNNKRTKWYDTLTSSHNL